MQHSNIADDGAIISSQEELSICSAIVYKSSLRVPPTWSSIGGCKATPRCHTFNFSSDLHIRATPC